MKKKMKKSAMSKCWDATWIALILVATAVVLWIVFTPLEKHSPNDGCIKHENTKPESACPTGFKPKYSVVVDNGSYVPFVWPYDSVPKIGDECLVYYDNGIKIARTKNDIKTQNTVFVRCKIVSVFVGK